MTTLKWWLYLNKNKIKIFKINLWLEIQAVRVRKRAVWKPCDIWVNQNAT